MDELVSGVSAPPGAGESEELLTLAEAVEFLGTSRPTMYRWLERGELKGLKVGKQWRFRRSDLVAYMERAPAAVAPAPAEDVERELAFFAGELERTGAAAPEGEGADTEAGEEGTDLLARQIMTLAVKTGASDIHMEPVRDEGVTSLLLRLRIDGLLHETRRMPPSLHEALFQSFKEQAGMGRADRRLPDEGRIFFTFEGNEYELRVGSLPTLFGEAMVMRVLDRSRSLIAPDLENLGLSEADRERVRTLTRQPNGLLLAAGPIGSGRSTLLYSALNETVGAGKKTYLVEERIEHLLPHATPFPINPRAGLTLAQALRALMKNDPDIVLVGEFADLETAQRIMHMALTGHLVLAQLHASSAAEAVARLVGLGVEPITLARTLIGVVSQRLVRRICASCKEPYEAPASNPVIRHLRNSAARGGYEVPAGAPFYRGRGCDRCRNGGYKGRTGIFEVMTVSEATADAIMRGASVEELTESAVAGGMRTLMADGLRKVVEGETTPEEVLRVLSVPL